MNKNMNSPTKLTEFAPLSPVETGQPVVASLFSKFFGFGKGSTSESAASSLSPGNDEQSSSGDSESWKRLDEREKENDPSLGDDGSSGVGYSVDASEGRSLPNVLKRISNIVALRSGNLKSYKDSQLRSFWMPDSVAKQCYECGERFTAFRRKHHCRVCGQIFCWKCCSDEIPGKIMGCIGDLRVCTYCCKVALSYLQSSDMRSVLSADLKALQEDLQVKYGDDTRPTRQRTTSDDETRAHRKSSVGYMEEKYALGRSSSSYLGTQGRSLVLKNSAPLRMIYEELFRSSRAIQLQTHRVRLKSHYNCFVGNELVNWLMTQNKTATRVQAAAIAQALLEAGFIESAQSEDSFGDGSGLFKPAKLSLVDLSDENQSTCDSQEPAWVTNIPQHDSTTDSESDTKQPSFQAVGRVPSSSSSFYLDLNVEASTVTLKRPTTEDLASVASEASAEATLEPKGNDAKSHNYESGVTDELLNDTLRIQEFNERNSWHKAKNLSTSNEELSSYNALTSAYKKHELSLIGQLLTKEGLPDNWTEPIITLAHRIVDQLRPDLNHDAEDMDIRQYVQFKKSPGASKNDCEIVSGVVCSKNVAHRGMNAMIANPKILLLKCGLMYQRVEGKLLSLEPVMLQENEYLGHTVGRITALGPDVVLVHRSVSRLAQDRFRQCGVTLVLNVKLSVLERVARCTGGTIVNTIDAHLTTRYKLGTCKKFYLRNFPTETNRPKTLMYFEGCANPHLGATILLRGGTQSELKRVKSVTSMMIFAAYSWRLEKSFLMDEFARPPAQSENSFLDDDDEDDDEKSGTTEIITGTEKTRAIDESHPGIFDDTTYDPSLINSSSKAASSIHEDPQTDSPMSAEAFKRVASMLSDASDTYDTLRLFKPRPRASLEILDRSEKTIPNPAKQENHNHQKNHETHPGDPIQISHDSVPIARCTASLGEKSSYRENIANDEKRACSHRVNDQSDPLHQLLREESDFHDTINDYPSTIIHEHKIPNFPQKSSSPSRKLPEFPLAAKFRAVLDRAILSFSPFIKFQIPYLETPRGRGCQLRRYFPNEMYHSLQLLEKSPQASRKWPNASRKRETTKFHDPLAHLRLRPPHPFVRAKLTSGIESRPIAGLLANFRASGSRLACRASPAEARNAEETEVAEEKRDKKPEVVPDEHDIAGELPEIGINGRAERAKMSFDCLEPINHQRLSVLFCSFSHSRAETPVFCVNPWIVNMDLYGRNDIALGGFLERYCLTDEYKCPAQSCRAEIAQHARRFAHESGCIHISLGYLGNVSFGRENDNERILMWSKCSRCDQKISPIVPMSDDTWSLSFGKYLELRFHAETYERRGSDDCRHSLHHLHSQYFARKNMLAVFRYSTIEQWEISLPPCLIKMAPDHESSSRAYDAIEEIKNLALMGDEIFTCIRENLSFTATNDQPETLGGCLKIQLSKEQQYLRNKIEDIQLRITSPSRENRRFVEDARGTLIFRIEDGIVMTKRLINETVVGWNTRLREFGASRKREDRGKRFGEKTVTSGIDDRAGCLDADDRITEDRSSRYDDASPLSADYNAIDAAGSAENDSQRVFENNESSDNEANNETGNTDEIGVARELPVKFNPRNRRYYHQRSHSDVLPIGSEDTSGGGAPAAAERKKKKKTILSQLLPSASNGNAIVNPLASSEHHSLPLGSAVPMVVYETEPSSIIAYALDSHDYKHALAEIVPFASSSSSSSRPTEQTSSPHNNRRKFSDNRENSSHEISSQNSNDLKRPSVLSFLRGNSPSPASPLENYDKSIASGESTAATNIAASTHGGANNTSSELEDLEKRAIKQQTYIEVQFHDSTTNFYCRIYFAAQFAALRENVLSSGEDGFTRSLCRSVQWAARGGKSGSTFCKSRDDRFILKELSRLELQIFLDFAPNYFAYMEKCQRTRQPTLLGKIVGVYRVSFKNNATNAALRTSLLVMENLFYGRTITDKFDLKGSIRNRLVNPDEADSEGELVLLDENLLNMSCDSPLYIRSHSKAVLNKAIEQDTKFLADNSVMDYSLLVGLEPNSNELVLGIIDYIRTFTWDKKLETMVKKSGILGGQGKLPTIVSPEEYRARFIAAMDRYFLPVPDRWTGLGRGVESTY